MKPDLKTLEHVQRWLKHIPDAVIQDWGLNAVGELAEWVGSADDLPEFDEKGEVIGAFEQYGQSG